MVGLAAVWLLGAIGCSTPELTQEVVEDRSDLPVWVDDAYAFDGRRPGMAYLVACGTSHESWKSAYADARADGFHLLREMLGTLDSVTARANTQVTWREKDELFHTVWVLFEYPARAALNSVAVRFLRSSRSGPLESEEGEIFRGGRDWLVVRTPYRRDLWYCLLLLDLEALCASRDGRSPWIRLTPVAAPREDVHEDAPGTTSRRHGIVKWRPLPPPVPGLDDAELILGELAGADGGKTGAGWRDPLIGTRVCYLLIAALPPEEGSTAAIEAELDTWVQGVRMCAAAGENPGAQQHPRLSSKPRLPRLPGCLSVSSYLFRVTRDVHNLD